FIRRWVEVTLVGETVPRFRGLLQWAGGTIAVFIQGPPPGVHDDPGLPLPRGHSIQITKIAEIAALPDPAWLFESNKAAAVVSAEELLRGGPPKPPPPS
ncbi:MAG: hypothetical protein JO263_01540, partial [Candidatus Eremiobacteraeota bacterium]|nr:hypothetical protein [Candidatus Eremiobacteraeota bacterium]